MQERISRLERFSVRGIGPRESGTATFDWRAASRVPFRFRAADFFVAYESRWIQPSGGGGGGDASIIFVLYAGSRTRRIGRGSRGVYPSPLEIPRCAVRGTQPAIRIMQMIPLYYTFRGGRFRFSRSPLLGTRSILLAHTFVSFGSSISVTFIPFYAPQNFDATIGPLDDWSVWISSFGCVRC